MKRLTLAFFIMFWTVFLTAQSEIHFESASAIGSRNLSFDFARSFWLGDYLDSTLKNNTFSRLKEKNTLGFYSQSTLEYFANHDSTKPQWYISLGNYNYFSLTFSSDLFQMVFEGNTSFVGKQSDLTPLNLNSVHFVSLSGGIKLPVDRAGKMHVSFSAGPVLGYSYANLDFDDLNYDATNVDTLKLNYKLKYCRQTADPFVKNIGAAINLKFEAKTSKHQWEASINNLGFLHLGNKTRYTEKSDRLLYSGIVLNEFDDLQNDVDHFSDSLSDRLSLNGDTASRVVALPFHLQAVYYRSIDHFVFNPSLRYIMLDGFIPELFVPVEYKVSSHWQLGTGGRFGGFSNPDMLLTAACDYKKFKFSFLLSGILAAAFSDESWGYNLQFKWQYKF